VALSFGSDELTVMAIKRLVNYNYKKTAWKTDAKPMMMMMMMMMRINVNLFIVCIR